MLVEADEVKVLLTREAADVQDAAWFNRLPPDLLLREDVSTERNEHTARAASGCCAVTEMPPPLRPIPVESPMCLLQESNVHFRLCFQPAEQLRQHFLRETISVPRNAPQSCRLGRLYLHRH